MEKCREGGIKNSGKLLTGKINLKYLCDRDL